MARSLPLTVKPDRLCEMSAQVGIMHQGCTPAKAGVQLEERL